MKRLLGGTVLAVALLLSSTAAYAATVLAASNSAVWSAVKAGHPGDTVLVGFSGELDIENLPVAAPGITIKPDPSKTVVIDRITADGSAGLTFTDFEVSCTPSTSWRACTYAGNASRIVFNNLHVHTKDGSYTGGGFSFRDTTDSAVTNSRFDHLGVGGGTLTSQRITISGNTFSDINTDGVDIASSCYVTVSGNNFFTFHPDVGAHPDAIQLWTVQAFPLCPTSEGNVIKDNIIRRETGATMQGIFSEAQKGLIITGNAMSGSMFNGISVSASTGADIGGNFVQGWTDDCAGQPCSARIITRGESSDVKVHDNTAQSWGQYQDGGKPNPNYVEANNVTVAAAAPRDYTLMNAWLAKKGGTTTPPPVVTPPATDPRDATIATLTAQVANLNTQVAALTKASNDNAAKAAALTVQIGALQTQVLGLKGSLTSIAATATAAASK